MHNIFVGGHFDSMMEGVATETSRKRMQGILQEAGVRPGWQSALNALVARLLKKKIKLIQRLVIQL